MSLFKKNVGIPWSVHFLGEKGFWKKKKNRKEKKIFQYHNSRNNIGHSTEAIELILIIFFFQPALYLTVFPLLQQIEGVILGVSQIVEISKLKCYSQVVVRTC